MISAILAFLTKFYILYLVVSGAIMLLGGASTILFLDKYKCGKTFP